MDLNQAEVAVTTQHLIDMGQEKDNLLQMSDFGDMGEFLCTSPNCFPKRKLRNTGTRDGRKSRTCSSTGNGCVPTSSR